MVETGPKSVAKKVAAISQTFGQLIGDADFPRARQTLTLLKKSLDAAPSDGTPAADVSPASPTDQPAPSREDIAARAGELQGIRSQLQVALTAGGPPAEQLKAHLKSFHAESRGRDMAKAEEAFQAIQSLISDADAEETTAPDRGNRLSALAALEKNVDDLLAEFA